ncbi:MAG: RtcB family protein [Planctomycetota bacterium]
MDLARLGIPRGEAMKAALSAVAEASAAGIKGKTLEAMVESVVENPSAYAQDQYFKEVAELLIHFPPVDAEASSEEERSSPISYRRWGKDIEPEAILQMENACRLPVTVAGALMPDAHMGYGLPIGGVLATKDAVIPYAVGMDIACRMKLSVLDLPVSALQNEQDRLRGALMEETSFGVGAAFKHRRQHPVMDEDWTISPVLLREKDKAWQQLGTSGSGNHFVEFGVLTLKEDNLGLRKGEYLALLSHSGSRGTGAEVARHYSRLAAGRHPGLSREMKALAWLDLKSQEGREYWAAMELMGRYAAANHALIHRAIAGHLGVAVLLGVENHHNFAWKEYLPKKGNAPAEEAIIHRKGATPAHEGDLGVIPGSMATPGFVVRGRGNAQSLHSAAHGAGRRMSRKAALKRYTWQEARAFLTERGVSLISAGLDEVPMAYKDIEEVMIAQADLVEIIARFDPKLVLMARS